ncbi:hypothetical protein L6164_024232 [Bauhinia variegata]|uniref:Uncharacterized protein n=1 Tax=Bauhinia variegata TaxID=167791 RepID=A0ACB9LX75_BAUVA|nr:hypothetical protein L6164_024232 [Bauhinia variegata]
MSPRSSPLYCLVFLLTFSSGIQAFNITRLLGQYPEFGAFNQYIIDSKLVGQINGRRTITVLAIDNSSIASISSRSKDAIKAIISTHVILDYYDEKKLMDLQGSSAILTTLYQASGIAIRRQGFINVAVFDGEVVFGSAVKGAPLNSKLVKTVATQPYNISVLQVTAPIIPPGIDAQSPWPAPGAETPLPHRKPKTPSTGDYDAAAESPEDAEAEAEAPTDAATPTPTPAPAPGPADKAADEDADDDGSKPHNGSTRTQMGLLESMVMGLVSLFVAL